MKEFFEKNWEKLKNRILSFKNDNTEEEASPFHSLSPISNADQDEKYSKMLHWAIKNRSQNAEDIKNIALTGPYGSGKSSILKSFQKKNHDKDLSFLNISLATFKEENSENAGTQKRNEVLRLIELSILQQIFYHEKDSVLPDTRFRKIQSFSKNKNWILSSLLLLVVSSILIQIFPDLPEKIFKTEFNEQVKNWIHYISEIIIFLGVFYLLFKLIRPLRNVQLKKFNFQGEIELGENISKSVLNDYLDEILYFFEVTKYNVVIVEDLDRFEQTEIFTKLREINLLINSSKKITRDVVFIYAVRDDMFKDKERTKFFDFIIPVIPVINTSNSNEKLLSISKSNDYGLSESLIDDISLFIDDMRLLYNVTNEYYLYRQKLGKKLNSNKLLAIILYKNIFPNDFVALSNNEGDLFEVFLSKNQYIKFNEEIINDKIKVLERELEMIKSIQITSIKELRMIYVLTYADKLHEFSNFIIEGVPKKNYEMLEESNFEYLEDDSVEYNYLHHRGGNNFLKEKTTVQNLFEKIEEEVDPKNTYEERVELIKSFNNNRVDDIKTEILALEREKEQLRHQKIKDILRKDSSILKLKDKSKEPLIKLLILNGYIDENYLDYISIFYEGSITRADRDFLLNIKSQIKTDYDHKLYKIEKLLPKIGRVEFERPHVLNHNLLDYLLSKKPKGKELSALMKMVASDLDIYFSFIDSFIKSGENIETFIKRIINANHKFWGFLIDKTKLPDKEIKKYFKLIIEYGEVESIKLLANHSNLKSYIENDTGFLDIIPNGDKISEIIKELNVKFKKLNFSLVNKELNDFVYEENHYEINISIIEYIIKERGEFNKKDFLSKNYLAISNSKCQPLIIYIDENIETYIENLYLKLEENSEEDETLLIYLLEHHKLSLDNKIKIIQKVETKISDLIEVEDVEVCKNLIEQSKTEASWENLIYYFTMVDNVFDKYLTSFLNDKDNVSQLSKVKINLSPAESDERKTEVEFIEKMVAENGVEDKNYEHLIKSIPYSLESLDLDRLEQTKIGILNKYKLLKLTERNYDFLRKNYDDLHIELIENYPIEFLNDLTSFYLSKDDILEIVNSQKFTIKQKNTLINFVEEEIFIENFGLLKEVSSFIIENDDFDISKSLTKHILTSENIGSDKKIKIFNKTLSQFDKTEITEILGTFPYPFSRISRKGKRPFLQKTSDNIELASNLKRISYIANFKEEKKGIRISTYRN